MSEIDKVRGGEAIDRIEQQKFIRESLNSQEANIIENPALKRCAEQPILPEKSVHQAYDRMYHSHSRT